MTSQLTQFFAGKVLINLTFWHKVKLQFYILYFIQRNMFIDWIQINVISIWKWFNNFYLNDLQFLFLSLITLPLKFKLSIAVQNLFFKHFQITKLNMKKIKCHANCGDCIFAAGPRVSKCTLNALVQLLRHFTQESQDAWTVVVVQIIVTRHQPDARLASRSIIVWISSAPRWR